MHAPKNAGRLVGLLYLLVSIPGFFWLIYVPHKLIVRGDASLTATNIAAHETLFRAGLACDVLGEILLLWVVLALYDLFKTSAIVRPQSCSASSPSPFPSPYSTTSTPSPPHPHPRRRLPLRIR